MGIRSLLRKVFGRSTEPVPETSDATSPAFPSQAERTPLDAAAELVAASFDNPTVPPQSAPRDREPGTLLTATTPDPTVPEARRPAPSTAQPTPVASPAAETPAPGAPAAQTPAAEVTAPEPREAAQAVPPAREEATEPVPAPEAEAEPVAAPVAAEPEPAPVAAAPEPVAVPAPEPVAAPEPVVAPEPAAEPVPVAAQPEAAPEPVAVPAPEPVATPEPVAAPEPVAVEPVAVEAVAVEAVAAVPAEPVEPAEPVAPEVLDVAAAAVPGLAGSAHAAAAVRRRAPGIAGAYKAAAQVLRGTGRAGSRAKVYLVLDRSGSMRPFYKDGSTQHLADHALALAAHLDEDATVHTVFFSTEVDGAADLTLDGHRSSWVEARHAALGRMGRTNYHVAVEAVVEHYQKAGGEGPALVLFQVDGAPDNRQPARLALAEAAVTAPGVRWQFVAFGEHESKAFDFVRKLDAAHVGFFHAGPAPADVPSAALLKGLLNGF